MWKAFGNTGLICEAWEPSFLRVKCPCWLGTSRGVVTFPFSATQIFKAGSLPVASGKTAHIIPTNSRVREAQGHRSRSHLGGMEECLHVPRWPGTAMASYMRSDSGPLEGSTSLKRYSCKTIPPRNDHDEASPGETSATAGMDVFFLCLAGSVWKHILAANEEERGKKCGICIKKTRVCGVSN